MSESSKIGTKTNPTDLAASSSSSSSSSPEIRTIEEPSTVTDSNRDTNPSVRPDYIVPLVGEKYSLSKRIVVDEIKIEKRWFTNTKVTFIEARELMMITYLLQNQNPRKYGYWE